MSKKIVSSTKIIILTIILAIFMFYGGGCGPPKGKGRISVTNTVDKPINLTIAGKTSIDKTISGAYSTSYDVDPGDYTVSAVWWDDDNVAHALVVSPASFTLKEGQTIKVTISE